MNRLDSRGRRTYQGTGLRELTQYLTVTCTAHMFQETTVLVLWTSNEHHELVVLVR